MFGKTKGKEFWQASDALVQRSVWKTFGVDDLSREKNVNYLLYCWRCLSHAKPSMRVPICR